MADSDLGAERPAGAPARVARWSLGGILLGALLVRIACFSGMTSYDEFAYVHIASNLLTGVFDLSAVDDYNGVRLPFLALVASLFAVLGVGPLAAALPPLGASLGNVGLAYALGKSLGSRAAGLVAALLHAVFPISVIYGTILYPEEPIVFLSGLSVLFFLKAQEADGGSMRRRALASGGILGIAAWLRPTSLAVALVLGVIASVRRRPGPFLWTGVGAACVVAIELGVSLVLAGDALHGWRVNFARVAADAEYYPQGMWLYPLAMLGWTRYGLALFGFFFPAAAAAVVLMAVQRRLRPAWIPLVWFGVLFLFFEFASSSPFEYRPLHRQFRYLSMLSLPTVLLVGIFVVDLWHRAGHPGGGGRPSPGRVPAVAIVVALVVSSVGGAWMFARYRADEVAPYKWVAAAVAREPGLPVYVPDPSWLHFLSFFLREEGALRGPFYPRQRTSIHRLHLASASSDRPASGGFILMDHAREPAGAWRAPGSRADGLVPIGVRGHLALYRFVPAPARDEQRSGR